MIVEHLDGVAGEEFIALVCHCAGVCHQNTI